MKKYQFYPAMVRCGENPRNATNIALGHLRQGILFIPKNILEMETKTNLVPLAEMLEIGGISASEMSELFDELAYDYAKTVIELQMADVSPSIVLHEKTDLFLHILRELRDVFKRCDF